MSLALERFYIPVEGAVDKRAALKCAFTWLLDRGENDLHIAFHRADIMADVLDEMAKMLPNAGNWFTQLKKDRQFTFTDGKRLTCAPWRPWVQAIPNGACLVIWAGLDELAAVETKLGSVGAVCATPWGLHEIQPWIDANVVPPVDCAADGVSSETSHDMAQC